MLSTDLSTDNPHLPRIYVVLIHFGSSGDTNRALESLQGGTATPEKIIIIDHAVTPYLLPEPYAGHVQLIRPRENGGYGGGVTVGLGSLLGSGIASRDVVIIMNNDCVVGAETISVVQTRWVKTAQPVLVGIQKGVVNLVTGRADLNKELPAWKGRTYVDGAFLVASYDTWLLLKGIPDQYFLYWEDVALAWQAVARGMALVAWPDLDVIHSFSEAGSEDKTYYLVRNGAVVLETMTAGPWRMYWWLKNRLRWAYHRDVILRSALADAVYRRLGKRSA